MPMTSLLPTGPDSAEWPIWSTLVRVVVTDPGKLTAARALVEAALDSVERAASRFHPSELRDRVNQAEGRTLIVSPMLAALINAALEAAVVSDGVVTPTLGAALAANGYDRDIFEITLVNGNVTREKAPDWTDIKLRGRALTMPKGMQLDLGATAKAHAADWCARLVAERLDIGVLVSIGGDIATAGPGPTSAATTGPATTTAATAGPALADAEWSVLVADSPDDPCCTVGLKPGAALATSSTTSRTWRDGNRTLHHILDPRTCQPAEPVWRTVSVAASTCLMANTLATAAIVRGRDALAWLKAPARLVSQSGQIVTRNGWPA